MEKIKILTDSACDISRQQEIDLDIKIMCFPITIDGKGYRERESFTNEEFYRLMDAADSIPTTAQVTTFEFVEEYKNIYSEGYTDIIQVTIASLGSNTYNAALMARDQFFEENPEAADKFKITIIDGKNYTAVYGYPVTQAAIKASKGASAAEITAYLEDWLSCSEVIFAPYTLDVVKKSGRVSCAAAFVGELLGLRPIIKIVDGVSSVMEKVRGDKNILPKIVELVSKEMIPQTPYVIMTGSLKEQPEELAQLLTKKFGYPPEAFFQVGAAVASNCGHKIAGAVFKADR
ncbi:MAG: DegV family protein [Oscillospiraceae bacterium]